MNWIYRGRCWKFGDSLGIDGDIMPLRFALEREMNAEVLAPFLMDGIEPGFAAKVKPGDIIVGGKRFGQGNPHIQGFLGIQGNGLGLVAVSIPRGSLRNAVNAGLPFLVGCEGVGDLCETGDELDVNFETGLFRNITRGTEHQYDPIAPELRAIVALGGWKESFHKRLAETAS